MFDVIESVDSVELADASTASPRSSGPGAACPSCSRSTSTTTPRRPVSRRPSSSAGSARSSKLDATRGPRPDDDRPAGRPTPRTRGRRSARCGAVGERLRDGRRAWAGAVDGHERRLPVAVEEGATIVRVGRAMFGERPNRLTDDSWSTSTPRGGADRVDGVRDGIAACPGRGAARRRRRQRGACRLHRARAGGRTLGRPDRRRPDVPNETGRRGRRPGRLPGGSVAGAPRIIARLRRGQRRAVRGRLAQSVRARGSHPRGHWFESSIAHHGDLNSCRTRGSRRPGGSGSVRRRCRRPSAWLALRPSPCWPRPPRRRPGPAGHAVG